VLTTQRGGGASRCRKNLDSQSAEKEDQRLATKLIPLADKLVIKPVVQEEVLASGIVIPDTAKEKPQQGEIIAVGPGRLDDDGKRIPMDLKAGDRILYAKYSGQEVKIDQEEYIVLSEKDVLCKVQIK
jgi:chaperonin GroES